MNTRTIPAAIATVALAFGLAACGGTVEPEPAPTAVQTTTEHPRYTPGVHNQGSKNPNVIRAQFPDLAGETDRRIDELGNATCNINPASVQVRGMVDGWGMSRTDAKLAVLALTLTYCPEKAGL